MRPRIPIVSFEGTLGFRVASWKAVEAAYGKPLPARLRRKVSKLTKNFITWANYENRAPELREAEQKLRKVKVRGKAFRESLRVELLSGGDSASYVKQILRRHEGAEDDTVRQLFKRMNSFTTACVLAEQVLERNDAEGFHVGDAWRTWIQNLSEVLEGHGLPIQVRKDSPHNKPSSPFVLFIMEIQRSCPAEFRRHVHSEGALAQGISEARENSPSKTSMKASRKSK